MKILSHLFILSVTALVMLSLQFLLFFICNNHLKKGSLPNSLRLCEIINHIVHCMFWVWSFTLALIAYDGTRKFDDDRVTTFISIFAVQTPRFIVTCVWMLYYFLFGPCIIRKVVKDRRSRLALQTRIRDRRNSASLIQPPAQIRVLIDSERAERQRLLIFDQEAVFQDHVPQRIRRGSLRRRIIDFLIGNEEESGIQDNLYFRLPIGKLKRVTYKQVQENLTQDQCSVCLENLKSEINELLVYLPCNKLHIFHETCILQWLEIRSECPLCRTRVTEEAIERYNNVDTSL